jgi:uncharacterized protein involved in response to NO
MIPIAEPGQPKLSAPRSFALFALGFRPFYLLGSLFATVSMLCWLAALHGSSWNGGLAPLAWHQHEMVFGFALAVIAGFTLTAGRVWTGLETLSRGPLALLAALWLAARVLLYTGPGLAAALVDVAFPFALAAVMANVLFRSGDRHNLFVVAFLCVLGFADAAFFLEQAGLLPVSQGKSVTAALYLVVTLVIMIGGRVVPSFTANALPRSRVVRMPKLDLFALALTLLAFVCALNDLPGWAVAPLAAGAALAHLVRQARWAPFATWRRPILWVMHLSYAWIALGLALLACSSLELAPRAASIHAFGVGAVGGMIIAMITRTALGHTGRPLRAGIPETLAYVLVHAGAVARLLASLAPTLGYAVLVDLSGALWSAAFLIYFCAYLPALLLSRPDGKAG